MNKGQFVSRMADELGVPKNQAALAYDAFLKVFEESVVAGERVNLQGIGKIKFTRRDARVGRNPSAGTSIDVPATTYVSFPLSWRLKKACADVVVDGDDGDGDDE